MTIKDIAKLSGYGIGTVSRVINKQPGVSEKAREKILKIIEESNFEPNGNARKLKRCGGNTVTIIMKGRHNSFFMEILDRITLLLSELDEVVSCQIIDEDGDEVAEALKFVRDKTSKAIIFLGANLALFDERMNELEINRRCHNEKAKQYSDYGGKGIRVADAWRNSFETFLKDMGQKPSPEHTIDRIDNDGNYEKGNCRWATKEVQANNTSQNVYYEYNGEKYTIAQLAKKFEMPYATMRMRLIYFPIEAAVDRSIKFETFVFKIGEKEKPMKDWLRVAGITFQQYVERRTSGLSVEQALLTREQFELLSKAT
jgi:hypothetical protein